MISYRASLKRHIAEQLGYLYFQPLESGVVVETAPVIDFVFSRSHEDMVEPFVCKVSYVADGYVDAFVFRAFDKGGEAIMIFPDVDKLPMVFTAHCFQVVQIFCLKALVIVAGVAPGRKFVREIFFEFCDFSHSFNSPLRFDKRRLRNIRKQTN